MSQCPKLDKELAAKGKGRNAKGDKGKGKASKSLDYAGVDADAEQQPAAYPAEQNAAEE